MYLILPKQQAVERNNAEAIKRGCTGVTVKWWEEIEHGELIALNVLSEEGLNETEIENLINDLPHEWNDEIINLN